MMIRIRENSQVIITCPRCKEETAIEGPCALPVVVACASCGVEMETGAPKIAHSLFQLRGSFA